MLCAYFCLNYENYVLFETKDVSMQVWYMQINAYKFVTNKGVE